MSLYLILMLVSILVPALLSFDKKLAFYKKWREVLLSILIVSIFYIIPDIFITKAGIWGFNGLYHSQLAFGGLPIEEYLFFIVIPYASMFLHYSLALYFPKFCLGSWNTRVLSIVLIVIAFICILIYRDRFYTVYAFVLLLLSILIGIYSSINILSVFYATFLIILIPFIIVDGVLTGSLITEPVVWYQPSEIIGIRVFTIPIEDFMYGFSMLFFNLALSEYLQKKFKHR